jgi:transcription antitermination factor NusG
MIRYFEDNRNMDARLEQILLMLAQQYAPQLLQTWKRDDDLTRRLPLWARQLADYNILVIMGDSPYSLQALGGNVNTYIQTWVNNYGQFYQLLARALFPSYVYLGAHYTDDKWPVVIYMQGAATPVIQRMAGYVAPFIVQRQLDKVVSEVELMGVMDLILDELEAGNLARDTYKYIRDDGVAVLKQMLSAQIRQLPVTEFDRPIFSDSQRIIPLKMDLPEALPEEDSQITHPDVSSLSPDRAAYNTPHRAETQSMDPTESINTPPHLPEIPTTMPQAENGQAESEKTFGTAIPIFFNRKGDKKRRPPVPPLPGEKDS